MDATPQDLGFPTGTIFRSLLVSEPAQTLVAHVSVPSDPKTCERLFARQIQESRYRELVRADGCNSWEHPVASASEPVVFALGMEWQNGGGHHRGIYRIPLQSGAAEILLARTAKAWWVSRLLGISADGAKLLVVRADVERVPDGAKARYSVQSLDLRTCEFQCLAELPAIFA